MNYDDDESGFEGECSSATATGNTETNEIIQVKRKPGVGTEENPERNTYAPYSKRSMTKGRNGEKRTVAILGDSMIRNIHYRELSKSCKNQKIYVKAFPSANVDGMRHYVLPTANRSPNAYILYCGTNSLGAIQKVCHRKKPDF